VLGQGGADTVLTSDGTDIAWAAAGGAADETVRVFHTAVQAIANATNVILAFDSEFFDTNAIHDNSTNNSRLTCKTAGVYFVQAAIEYVSNSTGLRFLNLLVNGADMFTADVTDTATGTAHSMSIAGIIKLGVDDYIEVRVRQTSGGSLNLAADLLMTPTFGMAQVAVG
jgi:hypothetical protein